jgi:DNA polymerase-4
MVAGIGTNKLVTYVAAEAPAGPGVCDVRPGDERHFLSPFPPTVLPQAARQSWRPILDILDDLNLRRLGAIAVTPLSQLRVAVGPAALALHRSANGLDDRAITPARQRPSITVTQSLGAGEIDRHRIAGILYGMVETVCRRLRAAGRLCLAVRTTLVYADYAEAISGFRPRRPSYWEDDLAPAIDVALARAAGRRVRIRSVALEAMTANKGPAQLALWSAAGATPLTVPEANGPRCRRRHRELLSTLDAIRNRFGDPAIGWGRVPRLGNPA